LHRCTATVTVPANPITWETSIGEHWVAMTATNEDGSSELSNPV